MTLMKLKKILNGFAIAFTLISLFLLAVTSISFVQAQKNKTIPNVFGFYFMFVTTPSMEPTLPVGSVIIVRQDRLNQLNEQDIITFHATILINTVPTDVVVTHRVIEIDDSDGLQITTKGDNNDLADTWTITDEELIGRVVLTLPAMKFLMALASDKTLVLFIVVVVIALFALSEGMNLIRDLTRSRLEKEISSRRENVHTSPDEEKPTE